MRLKLLKLLQASAANVLVLVVDDVFGVTAEDAGGLILLQDDRRTINIDFQCVFLDDVEGSAQFDRKDDASQFVNFTNDTGRISQRWGS